MIQITPHMRIMVAVEPIDFRAGIDGLVALDLLYLPLERCSPVGMMQAIPEIGEHTAFAGLRNEHGIVRASRGSGCLWRGGTEATLR